MLRLKQICVTHSYVSMQYAVNDNKNTKVRRNSEVKTILVIQRPPYIHFLLMFDMNTPDIQKHVWNVTIAICQINVNNIYV